MVRNKLIDDYLDWMYHLVTDDIYLTDMYSKLFEQLYDQEFVFAIPMDGNRAADGVDLRYRFGRECSYSDADICYYLDYRPCSILEMMVALAIRCEENIMSDSDIGDRTGQWFWDMIYSLGLISMTDKHYDSNRVELILERFLKHTYAKNGKGGLFTIHDARKDMRNMEIWYQMNLYLNELLKEAAK